jgi:hypothetical protein
MPANALPSVTLAAITKDNWKPAIRLAIEDRQKHFVAPNWYSILEALFSGGTLHSRAIMDGERRLYVSLGFEDTGRIEEGELIFKLALTSTST